MVAICISGTLFSAVWIYKKSSIFPSEEYQFDIGVLELGGVS